jgi:hypothetical protein
MCFSFFSLTKIDSSKQKTKLAIVSFLKALWEVDKPYRKMRNYIARLNKSQI